MALGNKLREIRVARGERLRAVAAAVEIDPTQLSKVERGYVGCSDEMKVKLAAHFGVAIGALFFQPVVDLRSTTNMESVR